MSAAPKLDLAQAAQRLTRIPNAHLGTNARERRRFRRLPLIVGGRMLDQIGREHDCRTADISPGDVRIVATILPDVGERVVLYLDGIGRVSGKVARRCGEGEMAVIFDFTAHKREKLAEQLTYTINKETLGLEEPERTITRDGVQLSRIEVETGEIYECEILDFSLTGITVKTRRAAPLIGSWVKVGGIYGRVARLTESGFAVDFEPRMRTGGR